MLISTKHRFVFIHVPKTGGSSITAVLAPYLDDPKPVDESQAKGWQIKHHVGKMHATAAESEIPEGFMVVAVRREYDDWHGSFLYHWPDGDPWHMNQNHWTDGTEPRLLRFERLQEDFAQFCWDVGLPPLALPHLNKHPR